MTGPGNVGDAMNRFSAEVGEIVTDANRVAADAAAAGESFRAQTDHLAEQARSGEVRPTEVDLTDEDLRAAATEFRVDNDLPVDELPSGRELLDLWGPVDHAATTEGTEDIARSSDQVARRYDDDEDFSQERILKRR